MTRWRGMVFVGILAAVMVVAVLAANDNEPDDDGEQKTAIAMSVVTPVALGTRVPEAAPVTTAVPHDAELTQTPMPQMPASEPQTPTVSGLATTPQPAAVATEVAPTATPVVDAPLRLRIPALGIDTSVQWVGLDGEGRMGVPDNYTDVAWYERGPRPGMVGNAVIAGHLDSATGPAVFFKLEELKAGDEIFVVTHDGVEVRFVVEETAVFDADEAPLERIFGPDDGRRLNLITCDGVFDRSSRSYDKRLVVFAVASGV